MYLWNISFSYKTTARKRKSIRYENWILVLFLPVVSRCKYVVCVPVPLRTVLLCVSFRKHVHYYRPCQGAGALPENTANLHTWFETRVH